MFALAVLDPSLPPAVLPHLQTAEDLITEAIQQLDGFAPEKRVPLVALAKYIGYREN